MLLFVLSSMYVMCVHCVFACMCSTSDGEVVSGDSQLVLVEPPDPSVLGNATPDPGPDHQLLLSQLSQVIADQKEVLHKMESDQQKNFAALQCEMQVLKESLLVEQKAALAEFKRDQRILISVLYFAYILYMQTFYICKQHK